MYKPLVSIITPVFNDARYIEKCMQSILTQSYERIEHVIIDGGSSDGTVEILSSYKNKHPDKIRFVSEPDKGGGDAWGKGLKMAKGDIFGIIGADDIYTPGAIKSAIDYFASHPDAYFICGDCDNIDLEGNKIVTSKAKFYTFKKFVNTAGYLAITSTFYKREVMEKIGWLEHSQDDFDVLLRMAKNFDVHIIDNVLSVLMVRPHSGFNSPANFQKLKEVRKQTFETSRRHGGSLFSLLALRHYAITIIDLFFLERFYPYMRDIYKKIRKTAKT